MDIQMGFFDKAASLLNPGNNSGWRCNQIFKQAKILTTESGMIRSRHVFSLTDSGVSIAEMLLEDSHNYPELANEKIITFQHEIAAQALTAHVLKSGIIKGYSTLRMMK